MFECMSVSEWMWREKPERKKKGGGIRGEKG